MLKAGTGPKPVIEQVYGNGINLEKLKRHLHPKKNKPQTNFVAEPQAIWKLKESLKEVAWYASPIPPYLPKNQLLTTVKGCVRG